MTPTPPATPPIKAVLVPPVDDPLLLVFVEFGSEDAPPVEFGVEVPVAVPAVPLARGEVVPVFWVAPPVTVTK